VFIFLDHLRLAAGLRPRRSRPARVEAWPSLTILRPIRGPDPGCAENTRALLEQDYPGHLDLLFVFDSVADPDVPVVSELLRTHPQGFRGAVHLCGAPPPGRTGKLNAMISGARLARGELLGVSDSDTRPPPQLARRLVEAFAEHPKAGATFAPVVTARAPHSAGETGYALLINAWYGPAAASAAGARGVLPFIMGELMLFRRDALAAIGGFEAAQGQLVDDMFLGARLREAGYQNVTVFEQLPLVTEPLNTRAFLQLFRKWVAFSQSGLPPGFVVAHWLRGAAVVLALISAGAALVTAQWVALALALTALLLWTGSQYSLHYRFSAHTVPLRYAWMPVLLPLLGAALSISVKLSPRVDWRGRVYALGEGATLASRTEVKRADTGTTTRPTGSSFSG
jgi:ceramide glucosyltransferase